MRRTIVAGVLAATLLLSGCGAAVDSSEAHSTHHTQEHRGTGTDANGYAQRITVDGVTCVVYDGVGGGSAISCDWTK